MCKFKACGLLCSVCKFKVCGLLCSVCKFKACGCVQCASLRHVVCCVLCACLRHVVCCVQCASSRPTSGVRCGHPPTASGPPWPPLARTSLKMKMGCVFILSIMITFLTRECIVLTSLKMECILITSLKMGCACSRTLLKAEDAMRVCMEMGSAYMHH